jgi:hypothetical protein
LTLNRIRLLDPHLISSSRSVIFKNASDANAENPFYEANRLDHAHMELTQAWEFVSDTVMGGKSSGQIEKVYMDGRFATRLTGDVSLENNGGFVQMAFDIESGGKPFDASDWKAVEVDVLGNGEKYDLRLRTADLSRPWESYRASFMSPNQWTTVHIPFVDFKAHKTDIPFDVKRIRRMGILAIGRVFSADLAVSAVRLAA